MSKIYITKWATTRGIVVANDAVEGLAHTAGHILYKGHSVHPNDWTEDRALAEQRWRDKVRRAHYSASDKAHELAVMLKRPPKFEGES